MSHATVVNDVKVLRFPAIVACAGNEPDLFPLPRVPAKRLGADFAALHRLIRDTVGEADSMLIGPDLSNINSDSFSAADFAVAAGRGSIAALSHHSYYKSAVGAQLDYCFK